MSTMDEINEMIDLVHNLDKMQNEIKNRIIKGKENYTEEDVKRAIENDVEVKALLKKCEKYIKK